MPIEYAIGFASLLIPPVGWGVSKLISHSQRLSVAEQAFVDLKELINQRFDAQDQRLERIERKVLNGDYRPNHR